jgi:hypothetical protein
LTCSTISERTGFTRALSSYQTRQVNDRCCLSRVVSLVTTRHVFAGGTIVTYNRTVTKNFRKDSVAWKTKNGTKSVRENHLKLKIDGKPVVHCSYAHGQDTPVSSHGLCLY